ncbi:hypothetical protein PG5_26090 [Pseudomonas sp. G5(2012)]|nr:hypothetical protein PG5_26090 [Pseudomonas sp. G5(2012)]
MSRKQIELMNAPLSGSWRRRPGTGFYSGNSTKLARAKAA